MCDHRGSPARPQAASRRRPPVQRSCRLPGRTDGTSGDSKRVRTDLWSSTIGQERANVPPFKLHCIDNMDLELPSKLHNALEREASDAGRSLHAHVVKKLESITSPVEAIDRGVVTTGLPKLVAFLSRVPGVKVLSSGSTPDVFWWVKLNIDLDHSLAWQVVQELGFVLNYISLEEKLPTVFKPVSPAPYMNGGPKEFLSWVIESTYNYIDPAWIAETLEGRLPRPVDDLAQWNPDHEAL